MVSGKGGGHDNLDQIAGGCQLCFARGACGRVALWHPSVPNRVHFGEIGHIGQPDLCRQNAGLIGASGGQNNAATTHGGYRKGMAIFTIAKGGLMYEAAIGGQKFDYTSL